MNKTNYADGTSSNKLYEAIVDSTARGNKVMGLIRECFKTNDSYTIAQAAQLIDECKRFDKAAKNARLSALRNAMSRVCKELDIVKHTVKKIQSEYAVVLAVKQIGNETKLTDFEKEVLKLLEKAQEEGQVNSFAKVLQSVYDVCMDITNSTVDGECEVVNADIKSSNEERKEGGTLLHG